MFCHIASPPFWHSVQWVSFFTYFPITQKKKYPAKVMSFTFIYTYHFICNIPYNTHTHILSNIGPKRWFVLFVFNDLHLGNHSVNDFLSTYWWYVCSLSVHNYTFQICMHIIHIQNIFGRVCGISLTQLMRTK